MFVVRRGMLGNLGHLRHPTYYKQRVLKRAESAGVNALSGLEIKLQSSMGSQTVVMQRTKYEQFERYAQKHKPVVFEKSKNERFQEALHELSTYFASLSFPERLRLINDLHGSKAVQVASMQRTATMIMHGLHKADASVRVAMIDTGYLPQETHDLADLLTLRLRGLRVESISPRLTVSQQDAEYGAKLWKTAHGQPQCCDMRKTQPLLAFLKSDGVEATVKGLLRADGGSRAAVAPVEYDPRTDTMSYHPLFDKSREEVEAYVQQHNLPEHEWYAKGYKSIGCAPCTTPCAPGEGVRAGRWRHLNGPSGTPAKQYCGINFGDTEQSSSSSASSLLTPPMNSTSTSTSNKKNQQKNNPYAAMFSSSK